MPTINNKIYDQPGKPWWDENNHLYLLKAMVNPWRVPYFSRILSEDYPDSLSGIQVLDIGCGGGYLTEEFAMLGCQVTGIDISAASIEEAITHAGEAGLRIQYQVGSATALDFADQKFDVVSCCDVLEHIEHWPAAVKEISRVLRPGGNFFWDTINRTMISWLTMIFGLEIFPLTRIFTRHTHIWRMFITPKELEKMLVENGFKIEGLSGGVIERNPLRIISSIQEYRSGRRSASELGEDLQLKHSPDLSQNYLGAARKNLSG